MASSKILAMENLFRLARQRASGTIPDEGRQSLPIPVREQSQLSVLFLFCPSRLSPREGALISPPDYVARMDPASGALIELRKTKPADFGQSHSVDQPIDAVRLPDDMTVEQYVELQKRLFSLYDHLLPHFAEGSARVPTDVRDAARELGETFARLREEPLAPYYAHAGREFFAWVNAVSR
jgi:hypothetical protein